MLSSTILCALRPFPCVHSPVRSVMLELSHNGKRMRLIALADGIPLVQEEPSAGERRQRNQFY
jgi:hypothetical protein